MSKDAIDDATLERIARDFCRNALGGPDSEIAAARERNLIAYNGRAEGDFLPPEIEDRSTFVSTDVADVVDGMLPQLLEVFVSDDKALECQPKKPGPEADAQARQATGYLNHVFYVRNDGLSILHDWMWDAALQKVGFVQVWAEEESEDAKQTYEGQTPDQLAMLLQEGVELAGEPEQDENGLLTFTTLDQSKRTAFKVACVPPHEMRIDPQAKYGEALGAIGRVMRRKRYELEELGIDVEGVGSSDTHGELSSEADALANDAAGDEFGELHESHRTYEYAELYFELDRDGDGIAEWVQVCLVNGTLVKAEQVDDHPFVEMCLMPRPHAYFGDCPADRAYQIQVEQTHLARALFDNVAFSVNQRTYINTRAKVSITDLLDNRPGGTVRGEGPPGEAFAPIPTIPINQSAWQLQEQVSVWRENRTGFTRYSQGMDADSLNKTATGVSIITQKSDQRLRLMTRHAAQSVRKMFAKLLKLVTRHQDAEDWFNVNGEWLPVRPTEWRDQFNITINVGLGHGTKEQQMQRLMALMPLMQWGQQSGVVRPEHIGELIQQAATVNEFRNPEKFADKQPQGLPDPQTWAQVQQQMQEMGGKLQQAEAAAASKDGDLQLKGAELQLKERELALREAEAASNADFRDREAQNKHDLESNTPERVQAEGERVGMEAFAEAAAMLAQAAQVFAAAQQAPRAVQIVGPSGQSYVGTSAPVMEGGFDG